MTVFLGVNSVVSLTLVSAFIISHASSQSLVPDDLRWSRLGFVEQPENNCGKDQFECKNGGCIHENLVCDGRIDCTDQSDETRAECTKPGRTCPDGAFRCDYGACAPQNATCNGIKDCFDNSDELLDECPRPLRHGLLLLRLYDVKSQPVIRANQPMIHTVKDRGPELAIPTILKTMQSSKTSTTTLGSTRRPTNGRPMTLRPIDSDSPSESSESFCSAPPQPANGKWILKDCHDDRGHDNLDCEIPQGADLEIDTQLYYNCDPGYNIRRFPLPRCLSSGKWSRMPVCTKVVDRSTTPENVYTVEEPTEKPPQSNPEITSTQRSIDTANIQKPELASPTILESISKSIAPSKTSTTTSQSIENLASMKTTSSSLADKHSMSEPSKPFCIAPPRPTNGDWLLGDVPEGTEIGTNIVLFYTCDKGYRVNVPLPRCLSTGEWTARPGCLRDDDESDAIENDFGDNEPPKEPLQSNPETTSRPIEKLSITKTTTPSPADLGNPSSTSSTSFCLAPPQPANGKWMLIGCDGSDNEGCQIPEGAKIETNSLVQYACDPGYSTRVNPLPRCLSTGKWSRTPVCTKVDPESETDKPEYVIALPPEKYLPLRR